MADRIEPEGNGCQLRRKAALRHQCLQPMGEAGAVWMRLDANIDRGKIDAVERGRHRAHGRR
jgi:hypothetical protein